MTIRHASALAAGLLLASGCEQGPAEPEPVATAPQAVERPAGARPATEQEVPRGISEITMTVGEGEEAATVRVWLAPEGDGTCTQAYNTSMAWVQGMQRLWGGTGERFDRHRFMDVCARLPEEVKRCMLLDYAFQNRRSCEQARDDLDPALAAELRSVSPVAEP